MKYNSLAWNPVWRSALTESGPHDVRWTDNIYIWLIYLFAHYVLAGDTIFL